MLERDGSGLLLLLRSHVGGVQWCWTDDEEELRASLLPPLPNADELFLRTLPADGGSCFGTGGRVWQSARALCIWLRQHMKPGARVLDLGCGTGAVGLYCAALGASHAVLTDEREELLALARHNWRCNMHVGTMQRATVDIHRLRWGHDEPPSMVPAVDLIVGSDVIYDQDCHMALCLTLERIVRAAPHARLVLCTMPRLRVPAPDAPPARFTDDALLQFARVAARHGLHVRAADEGDEAKQPSVDEQPAAEGETRPGSACVLPVGLTWSAAEWSELGPFCFLIAPIGGVT